MCDCIILSILIISHNQKEQLRRCVESVLAQDLPFEHEIIISDDASTDGTWELIQEYVSKYPNLIQGYQVNSNDCNPTNTSERSGHNRANAYRYASGKYFVHIDGDDYLKGNDCYKLQVEQLEDHPECSMCMQNIWCVTDGEPIESGHSWHPMHKYTTGRVVTPKEFFLDKMFLLNQAFVARWNPYINPADIYHKFYVDDIITFHHLQFGPIVCIDRCDYVYVENSTSISSTYHNVIEKDVFLTLDLTVAASIFIPKFTGLYYACYKSDLLRIVNLILKGGRITNRINTCRQFDAFIYQVCVKEHKSMADKIRLQAIRFWLILLIKIKSTSSFAYKILHKLLVGGKINPKCNFKIE